MWRRSPTQMSMLSPMSARQISKMCACEWLIYFLKDIDINKYIYIFISIYKYMDINKEYIEYIYK